VHSPGAVGSCPTIVAMARCQDAKSMMRAMVQCAALVELMNMRTKASLAALSRRHWHMVAIPTIPKRRISPQQRVLSQGIAASTYSPFAVAALDFPRIPCRTPLGQLAWFPYAPGTMGAAATQCAPTMCAQVPCHALVFCAMTLIIAAGDFSI
jgi:hypothetical protein